MIAAGVEMVGSDLIDWAAARLGRFEGVSDGDRALIFATAAIGVVMSMLCASGMPAARAAEAVGATIALVAEDLQ